MPIICFCPVHGPMSSSGIPGEPCLLCQSHRAKAQPLGPEGAIPENTPSIEDTRTWGWSSVGSETAEGPFETREEAIEDARAHEQKRITLARCGYPDPGAYIAFTVGEVLERMEERAGDDGFSIFDDLIFDLQGKNPAEHREAEVAFQAALIEWARKYVTSSHWLMEDTEDLELPDT